jgi:hypothetical protein
MDPDGCGCCMTTALPPGGLGPSARRGPPGGYRARSCSPGVDRGCALRLRQWLAQLPLHQFSWRQILVPVVALADLMGVVASMGMAGRLDVGTRLTRQVPNMPAVASDQAQSFLGGRVLAITGDPCAIGYRLLGSEPGPVVRDLPGAVAAPDPLLAAVKSSVWTDLRGSANAARDALADLGVGFASTKRCLGRAAGQPPGLTAGFTRLSHNNGLTLWRVVPCGYAVGSSRLRFVDAASAHLASIPVTRPRSDRCRHRPATGASAAGRRLVAAEPNQWAAHARVTFAGRRLATVAGAEQPTSLVPRSAGRLSITVASTHQRWRWGQLGLLLVALFIAASAPGAPSDLA